MEDEVFEMDEFAVDPQRGAGIGELGAFEEARPDGRTGDTFVQTCESGPGVAFTSRFQSRECHTPVGFWR